MCVKRVHINPNKQWFACRCLSISELLGLCFSRPGFSRVQEVSIAPWQRAYFTGANACMAACTHIYPADVVGGIVTTFVLAVIFEGLRSLQEYVLHAASRFGKQPLVRKDSVIEILPRGSCNLDDGGDHNPTLTNKKSFVNCSW